MSFMMYSIHAHSPRTRYPSKYLYTWKRVSRYSRISIPRCRWFPANWTVLRSTTMVEWRLGCVPSVPRASRCPSRVPPRYTNPSRTRGLPRRFLSRTMVRLNYYVAPPFAETTVKVSRLRVHDCNFCTWSSLYERLTTTTQHVIQCTNSGMHSR